MSRFCPFSRENRGSDLPSGADAGPSPRTTIEAMAKRLMIAVVGAGIGVLAGLLVDSMGAGTPALVVGAVAGALIPQFVLGPPGH